MEAQAATVEADESGFEELKNQLMQKSSQSGQENTEESREEDSAVEEKERSEPPRKSTSKKFVFRKGDEVYELDEDFKAVRHYFLGDQEEIKKKMEAVAAQGSAKK